MRLYYAFVVLFRLQPASGFQPLGNWFRHTIRILEKRTISSRPVYERRKIKEVLLSRHCSSSPSPPPPSADVKKENLSVREIKAELQAAGVAFADCFDKESLLKRLQDFRNGSITSSSSAVSSSSSKDETTTASIQTPDHDDKKSSTSSSPSPFVKTTEIDRDALVQEIRSMRVKELREELARRHLRWAGMLEKEDLVRAVLAARIQAANFSITGLVSPGQVADLTGDQVEQELTAQPGEGSSLLLVDAYAVSETFLSLLLLLLSL
jgi:hypothetical protein